MEKSLLGAITNNITLAIRPEHISISFGASFPEDNLLKAEITKSITREQQLESNSMPTA